MFTNKKQRYHQNKMFWAESRVSLAGLVYLTHSRPYEHHPEYGARGPRTSHPPASPAMCSDADMGLSEAAWTQTEHSWTRAQLVRRRKGQLAPTPTTELGQRGSCHPELPRWLTCVQCPFIEQWPLWAWEDTDPDRGHRKEEQDVSVDGRSRFSNFLRQTPFFYHYQNQLNSRMKLNARTLACTFSRSYSMLEQVLKTVLKAQLTFPLDFCSCSWSNSRSFFQSWRLTK